MEVAAGARLVGGLRDLRRLIYCGEWIESHALHVFFLHAPDFLGYESAIAMAGEHPDRVATGLRLKKVGNGIMTLLGGREIHPINVRVGGFYRVPTRADLLALVPDLEWALEAAIETVDWVSSLPFPDFERDYEFVSLSHPDEYPIHEGRIVSNRGLDIGVDEWEEHFEESHVAWSNALHARRQPGGTAYHVGPMARYSLNFEKLTPRAGAAALAAGLEETCRNPFRSIVVRAVEIAFACEEALRLIDGYSMPDSPFIHAEPRSTVGHGASEAPRGLLYHRYTIDGEGLITDAHIVPPTSQNQLSIEDDLRAYVPGRAGLPDDRLQWELEQAIRCYDPCISCATHFLDLTVERQ
jgi:coenzyme F420-reducing hydrogenase alpha subunit